MPDTVCALVCRHYRAEAECVCARSAVPRVRVDAFPARCGRPCLDWPEIEGLRQRPDEPLVVFGGPCLDRLDPGEGQRRGITVHRLGSCLEMVLNPRLLEAFQTQGTYLMTSGWLQHWRANLARQGNDPDLVRDLWRESIAKLLLLDTGVGEPLEDLASLTDHLGLPGEVLPTGLDHMQLLLEREVLEARLHFQRAQAEDGLKVAQRQAADRATAMEFLGTLSQSLREEDVVQGIRDLFQMLFHAREVAFLPWQAGEAAAPLPGGRAYQETPDGFRVAIGASLGPVGTLTVEGLAFPNFRTHYLNLALSMAGVCALAIQNARTYRAVEDSRAYQRLMLDILDAFYQPQGSGRELQAALGYLQDFAGVDALALRVRGAHGFGSTHLRGYPAGIREQACDRCLVAMAGGGAPPEGARQSPRGSLWMDELPEGPGGCACAGLGFRSMALIPIRLHGGVFGVLQLHHRDPGFFTPVMVERLEGATRSIGIGLERRAAEDDLRRMNRELEQRVQQRTAELAARNQELRLEIQERTRAEASLEAQSEELKARLKELHCLYALSSLFEQHEGTLEGLLRQAIALVPGGWQDPGRTWARIRLDSLVAESPDFRETGFALSSPLSINGAPRGALEVYVDPADLERPFLEEEEGLVRTMADLLQGLVDHLEAEEERRRVEQRLVQSQKLEALGTLAGGIAHDFNNALTPIIALADVSLMNLTADSPLRRHLELIKQSGDRAKGLVDQILLFSRRKAPNLQPLELPSLLKEILKLIRATLPATIEIRQDLDPACGRVLGDPTQVHQIAMNLCTNAFHAMQERGGLLSVSLRSCRAWRGGPLENLGLPEGDYVALEVSDTGTGMPPEVQARIFEPFFTTKEQGKGTGMGLSVVHGIVSSYGGAISVYSEPGQGTRFRIFLPVAQEDQKALSGPVSPPAAPRGHERILVVDDEEGIRFAVCAMLRDLGYQAESAPGGLQALERIQAEPGAFDLVLTDMTMPRITGLELARRVHEVRPDVPVVLCSGFSDRLQPEHLVSAGIREFVQKPFEVFQLAQALRRELDRGL